MEHETKMDRGILVFATSHITLSPAASSHLPSLVSRPSGNQQFSMAMTSIELQAKPPSRYHDHDMTIIIMTIASMLCIDAIWRCGTRSLQT